MVNLAAVLDWGGDARRHVMRADRFFPSTQTNLRCGVVTDPKRREEMNVEGWGRSECGAEHLPDGNAGMRPKYRAGTSASTGMRKHAGKRRG